MASEVIPTDKQYPKLSKVVSGYLEIDHFKNADLHSGYFCYNCIYFIKEHHCAIVEGTGPDVNAKESGIIAPHGVCTLWDPKRKGGAMMTDIEQKIKEAFGNIDNLTKFKKRSKLQA